MLCNSVLEYEVRNMIPESFGLKLIRETAEDFDRVAQFYRDAID